MNAIMNDIVNDKKSHNIVNDETYWFKGIFYLVEKLWMTKCHNCEWYTGDACNDRQSVVLNDIVNDIVNNIVNDIMNNIVNNIMNAIVNNFMNDIVNDIMNDKEQLCIRQMAYLLLL